MIRLIMQVNNYLDKYRQRNLLIYCHTKIKFFAKYLQFFKKFLLILYLVTFNHIFSSKIWADENTEIKNSADINISIDELDQAELVILNKITAKSVRKLFNLDELYNFGNLSFQIDRCVKNTDLFNANNLALLSVYDQKPTQEKPLEKSLIFYGWLISSNLSISNIEHPVYEIMVMDCKKSITN